MYTVYYMAIDFPNSPANNDSYTSGGRTWLYNGTAWTLLTLTQTIIPSNSVTSSSIVNDTIVNADINSAAAIALSKLASGTSGQIVVANSSGVPAYATVSGDITITDSGNAQIVANAITATEISDSTITNAKLANTSVTIGSTAISLGGSNTTIAGLTSITSANANISTALTSKAVIEPISVSATASTGTINIDFLSNPGVYYTTNASANWTLNVRGNSSTTLNSILAIGDMASVTFLAQQGSTAYYANVIQVDGSTISPKWQGGTAPSAGNASSIDGYSLTILKTANATFTVFASQTRFA